MFNIDDFYKMLANFNNKVSELKDDYLSGWKRYAVL